jgi:hypothetical protein
MEEDCDLKKQAIRSRFGTSMDNCHYNRNEFVPIGALALGFWRSPSLKILDRVRERRKTIDATDLLLYALDA